MEDNTLLAFDELREGRWFTPFHVSHPVGDPILDSKECVDDLGSEQFIKLSEPTFIGDREINAVNLRTGKPVHFAGSQKVRILLRIEYGKTRDPTNPVSSKR